MANMTIAIPDDLHAKMRELGEVRWSEVARQAFEERINSFEIVEAIARKSKLTQKDVDEIADMIDKATYKRIKRKCG